MGAVISTFFSSTMTAFAVAAGGATSGSLTATAGSTVTSLTGAITAGFATTTEDSTVLFLATGASSIISSGFSIFLSS